MEAFTYFNIEQKPIIRYLDVRVLRISLRDVNEHVAARAAYTPINPT